MNEFMGKISTLSFNRIAIFGFLLTGLYFVTLYNNGDLIASEIQNLQGQIASETTLKAETERILKKEEEMRVDVASLAKTYEAVKAKVPIDFETSELRVIVEQISAATELRIEKLTNADPQQVNSSGSTGSSVDANLVQKVAISYVFQGNFPQLQNFMTQIAAVEKIVKVSELKIRTTEGTSGPSKHLTIEAVLEGFRQATVAAAKLPELPSQNNSGVK